MTPCKTCIEMNMFYAGPEPVLCDSCRAPQEFENFEIGQGVTVYSCKGCDELRDELHAQKNPNLYRQHVIELRRKLQIACTRLKDACCCYGQEPSCVYCDAVEEIK